MKHYLIAGMLIILSIPLLSQDFPKKKKHRLPEELPEVSGLYLASPDSLWWLNDGEHPAELYLTDGKGTLLRKVPVPRAINRDWEDLTADGRGNLYIGDFGNNLNRRQDLAIYIFNPASGKLDSIRFHYPDQQAFPPQARNWNFDMEAFFWFQDSLHLFSKNRLHQGNYYTKHYTIPASPGAYEAVLRDSLYLKKRVVTAAAISPDGQSVALLAYWFKPLLGFIPLTPADIFILTDFTGSRFLDGTLKRQKAARCFWPTQFEALDYLNPASVWIASERTILYKQKMKMRRLKRGK
ncbi:MAG: hypothetical protein H6556_22955 [Lewinellaceae bacterium]|nr:hypothetical protein [Lewinellaceae bacterium]